MIQEIEEYLESVKAYLICAERTITHVLDTEVEVHPAVRVALQHARGNVKSAMETVEEMANEYSPAIFFWEQILPETNSEIDAETEQLLQELSAFDEPEEL